MNAIKSYHGELKIEIKDQNKVFLKPDEFVKILTHATRFITGICLMGRKIMIDFFRLQKYETVLINLEQSFLIL
jgi:hypothetical protein